MNPDFFVPFLKGISRAPNIRILELTFERVRLNHVHFNKGIK